MYVHVCRMQIRRVCVNGSLIFTPVGRGARPLIPDLPDDRKTSACLDPKPCAIDTLLVDLKCKLNMHHRIFTPTHKLSLNFVCGFTNLPLAHSTIKPTNHSNRNHLKTKPVSSQLRRFCLLLPNTQIISPKFRYIFWATLQIQEGRRRHINLLSSDRA
jgi:hypothetical protein